MSRKGNTELNTYINYQVDKKSRQVVNREICVAPLGRTKVKGNDPFNEVTANGLLEKHLKKRAKAVPAIFLVDRIRFTKKGFHEYLNYREIQNFHRFQQHPDKFMLYVVEERKGRRSYESYRCDNPADVQTIRDMITVAHSDPKRLLQEVGPTRLLSVSSSSSSEYYLENKSDMRAARPRSIQYVHNEPMVQPQYVYSTAESPVNMYRKPTMNRSYSRPPSVEPRNDMVRIPSLRNGSMYESGTRNGASSNDVTYLRSDNINGPQIMDHGPVYMYVSRSRQQLNQNQPDWSPDQNYGRRNNNYY